MLLYFEKHFHQKNVVKSGFHAIPFYKWFPLLFPNPQANDFIFFLVNSSIL